MTYRIYHVPENSDRDYYCGERETLEEAREFAESEPVGQPEMPDPEDGTEDARPEGWYGPEGQHIVVRAEYPPPAAPTGRGE